MVKWLGLSVTVTVRVRVRVRAGDREWTYFLAQYIGACFGEIFPGESFPLYGTECLLGGCN